MRSRDHKRLLKRIFSPVGIIVLLTGLLFFHLVGHHVIRSWLGYVYTPPALTPEKIIVYTEFIKFAQDHPEYSRIHVDMFRGRRAELYDPSTKKEGPSIDSELLNISRDFKRISCIRADKYYWYIIFMPRPNYILPTTPGVLYSLDGENPNDVDDEYLNSKKPFFQIKDSWFTSRALAVNPLPMGKGEWSLPKCSLFDHSLQYPGEK